MPLWKLNLSDFNPGLGLAAGFGVGFAGTCLIQKLVRRFQDHQNVKKPVNVVKPSSGIWTHVDMYSVAETGKSMDRQKRLPPRTTDDNGRPMSTVFAECFKEAGEKLRKQESYEEAIAAYTDGADCCTADERFLKAKIYGCRASVYQGMGDIENVIANCTLSLAQYNGDEDIYRRRAVSYIKSGRLEEALGDYATIAHIVRYPEPPLEGRIREITQQLAYESTMSLYRHHSHAPPPKYVVNEFLERFHNHPLKLVGGSPATCGASSKVDLVDRAVVHAQTEFLAGNVMAALLLDEKQITASSNPEKFMLLKATAMILYGCPNSALNILLPMKIKPNMDPLLSATILIQIANLLYGVRKSSQAESCFDRALALTPDNADVFFHRGEEFLKLGDYLKAIDNYNQALRLKPDSVPAMTAKALALIRQNSASDAHFHCLEQSDDLFQELLEKHPDHYLVHFIYARVRTNRHNLREAEKHFDIAHNLAPHIGNILTLKADMYLMDDRKTKALESLEKALLVDPSCVKAYEKMGYMQIERNMISIALKMFETGLHYAVNSRDFHDMYAMYYTAKSKVNVAINMGLPIAIDGSLAKRLS